MPKEIDSQKSPIAELRGGLYDAAELIGKSIKHVRNLVKEGFIEEPVDGQYSLQSVASGALKARDAADRRVSQSAAASRLADERAEEIRERRLQRQQVMERAGQEAALAVMDTVLGPLRADLTAMPARVTADVRLRRAIEDQLDLIFAAAHKRTLTAADRIEPSKAPANRKARRLAAKRTRGGPKAA